MTTLSWTKDWGVGNNGETLNAVDIKNIQDDIEGVVNGNLDNANFSATGGIEE